jgi:4'-phosphopantetheinyl transferase
MNRIRLYYLYYQHEADLAVISESYIEKWLSALPPTKQAAINRLIHKTDRIASLLATRLLLMCAQHENLSRFRLADLRYPDQGKPCWKKEDDNFLDFNISHTDKLIVVATSTTLEVGVDAERIRTLKSLKFKMVLSPEELSRVKDNPGLFFELWSKKEAVVKAANTTGINRMRDVKLKNDYAVLDGRKWYFKQIDMEMQGDDDYVIYLASSKPVEKIITKHIAISEIV